MTEGLARVFDEYCHDIQVIEKDDTFSVVFVDQHDFLSSLVEVAFILGRESTDPQGRDEYREEMRELSDEIRKGLHNHPFGPKMVVVF